MKIVKFNNGSYAIRKFSISRLKWVYLDLKTALDYIREEQDSRIRWKATADALFSLCCCDKFETVNHIYHTLPRIIEKKRQDPYGVAKVFNDDELFKLGDTPWKPWEM